MTNPDIEKLKKAVSVMDHITKHGSDGSQLEFWTKACAPLIDDWDIDRIWRWMDWPDREKYFRVKGDHGIDFVGYRKRDDALVAIQCKALKSVPGKAAPTIRRSVVSGFLDLSRKECFKERWVVTNSDAVFSRNVNTEVRQLNPVRRVSLREDLVVQIEMSLLTDPVKSSTEAGLVSRDEMQSECIKTCVHILRTQSGYASGKSPRGKIILPCGTGKTRIALRIVEELTQPGEVSSVLCPSIALIAQIRYEFLRNTRDRDKIRILAVCSDGSVAKHPSARILENDPLADIGMATTQDLKGQVTTDPYAIKEWMDSIAGSGGFGVILSTYQSSHKVSLALSYGVGLAVTIADEAHRTAGLKKNAENRRAGDQGLHRLPPRRPMAIQV